MQLTLACHPISEIRFGAPADSMVPFWSSMPRRCAKLFSPTILWSTSNSKSFIRVNTAAPARSLTSSNRAPKRLTAESISPGS